MKVTGMILFSTIYIQLYFQEKWNFFQFAIDSKINQYYRSSIKISLKISSIFYPHDPISLQLSKKKENYTNG